MRIRACERGAGETAAHARNPGGPDHSRQKREWWAHQDSNLGLAGYEPAALTAELWAPREGPARRGRGERASRGTRQELGAAFEERLELAAARWVPQLAERL